MKRLVTYIARPAETAQRIVNKIEFVRDRDRISMLSHDDVRDHSLRRYGYHVDDRWRSLLRSESRFNALWQNLTRRDQLDADRLLAWLLWSLADGKRVVETGVARGVSSRVMLEAGAELWSIDLPPLGHEHATLVPKHFRPRWRYIRGSSRRMLPRVLEDAAPLDLFVHDSQHTLRTMRFEFAHAWPFIKSGGVLVADDIHENAAFKELVETVRCDYMIGQGELKASLFGVAFKP